MATNSKFWALLRVVRGKTERGEMAWEETPDENSFKAIFHSGTLMLSKEVSYGESPTEDVHWVRVELLTPDGRVANQLAESSVEDQDRYRELLQIWQAAQVKARKGDQLLDALLREVG